MEENEEFKPKIKIETVDITYKIGEDLSSEIKVEKESDSEDGSNDESQFDNNSPETSTSHGTKRNKNYNIKNKKIKMDEEDSDIDSEIEQIQSNDPLDVNEDLNDNDEMDTDKHRQILEHFKQWQLQQQVSGYTEDIFLSYFKDLDAHLDATSLWNTYCFLKIELLTEGIDLNKYNKLKYYVRKATDGFRENSRVFTVEDIDKYLNNATDDTHLASKVALVIGVTCGCDCNELKDMKIDDVNIYGDKVLVNIQESNKKRWYVVPEKYAIYIKKYISLRPNNLKVKQLLVPCENDTYFKRAMSKKTIGCIPADVATFLNLPNAEEYTGDSYKRSFTILNNMKVIQSNANNDDSDNENLYNYVEKSKKIDNKIKINKKMPKKIYKKFLEVHDLFKSWMKKKLVPYIFEDCVLTYFKELAEKYKPSSLWKLFTMLRYMLLKENIDIRTFKDVIKYINEKMYESNNVAGEGAFSAKDIDVFMKEAPDDQYLGAKVALVLGVSGACNCRELLNITYDNVIRYSTTIIVKLNTSNKYKTFIIPDNYFDYIIRYIELRPKNIKHNKFLINFKNGKYTRAVMSKAIVRNIPKEVANYLKLSNRDVSGHYYAKTAYILFNLTTISICDSDIDDISDTEYESDNVNKKYIEIHDIKIDYEKPDKHSDNKNNQNCEELTDVDNDNSKTGWQKYDEIYNYYLNWINEKTNNINEYFTEDNLVQYFNEIAEKRKPSAVSSQYYILKHMLKLKNDVDISEFDELKDILKRKGDVFLKRSSRVFTINEIDEFLDKAPDDEFLLYKVALILGIKGACKTSELINLTTDNVKEINKTIIVTIHETINMKRKFYLTDKYYTYVKKYMDMRPNNCKTNKFLLQLRHNKILKSCVGKSTLTNIPKDIAKYLNLPFPEEYNGNCYKSSAMKLINLEGKQSEGTDQLIRDEGLNEANVWPKDEARKALCWPLMTEVEYETEETDKVILNSETGVFEILD